LPPRADRTRRPLTLITGGAGFVGTNLATRILADGGSVRIFDNLSRPGVERNLRRLLHRFGSRVDVKLGDIRDPLLVRNALRDAEAVFHFAAQVAVTTSVVDPVADFAVNAEGTLRLLEELRRLDAPPPLLFTSTNKVYGTLGGVTLVRRGDRWEPGDQRLRHNGISECAPLDFCTPYGCSKGAADQYVLDYAKTYGVPAIVFRMSCIYGPHQHGNEDQGWVAHFLLRALANETITVYGDGAQVRDILYVDDLVDAMLLAARRRDLDGNAFNVGGGPECAVSLLEVLDLIEAAAGSAPSVAFARERIGDQRYYVSDTTRLRAATGWKPRVLPEEGIEALHRWFREHARRPAAVAAATG
jgi:CDP-paratose 2-epimerase